MRHTLLRIVLLAALTLPNARPAHADADNAGIAEEPMDAAKLAHALDRLAGTGRVLYVAAHPDDENTRLLAYLANGRHLTAAYLSMTRGGGGQNLIGSEQDELLDSIRTHELLAARTLDSAEQRFTRMRDFGYSKTAAETLAVWGQEAALADVVLAIRTFQPDVIVTRFDERPPNHGHHIASAILAKDAFSAAADPARFPEQLKAGIRAWQAKRIVYNVPHWRDLTREPLPPDALSLDVGVYDPRLGLSYGELAARSRSQHKSQGFGIIGERGELIERFIHVAGVQAKSDLLEGVVGDWSRYGAAAEPFAEAVREARKHLHRDHPERSVAALLQAYAALAKLPDEPRTRDARSALSEIIATASGLFVRATATRPAVAPGSELPIKLELVARGPIAAQQGIVLQRATLADGTAIAPLPTTKLEPNRVLALPASLRVAANAPISVPHWLTSRTRPDTTQADARELAIRNEPLGPAPLSVAVELQLGAQRVTLTRSVVYSWNDRIHGERVRPVLVMPPATVTPARQAVMLPNGRSATVALRVRASEGAVEGSVDLGLPAGWTATPATQAIKLARAGDETVVSFAVKGPRGAAAVDIEPAITVGGARFAFREDVIDYAHVPLQVVLQKSRLKLVPLKLSLPAGLVGYVAGPGDTVAADLAHVGVHVEAVDDDALRSADLGKYAAIVLGVRAYNTRTSLRGGHERLMRYAERGGVVIVQYNTSSPNAPLDVPIGPFPLKLGRGRVTDETAAVKAHGKAHSVLTQPNRIDATDWQGWVQERGLYFAESYDERYTPVLEMNDPEEPAQLGSLLVARHGQGRYVYTGLAFFRQLPAGVPGAYRLLVNLLSK
jgi:LmbE family N-acetylglucosaminyl deacetylase